MIRKNKGNILLVEDDKVDAMTVKRALKEIQVPNQLNITTNGEEALENLQNSDNELPIIILLDLNMPKMNGIELAEFARFKGYKDRIYLVTCQPSGLDSMAVDAILVKPILKHDFKQLFHV